MSMPVIGFAALAAARSTAMINPPPSAPAWIRECVLCQARGWLICDLTTPPPRAYVFIYMSALLVSALHEPSAYYLSGVKHLRPRPDWLIYGLPAQSHFSVQLFLHWSSLLWTVWAPVVIGPSSEELISEWFSLNSHFCLCYLTNITFIFSLLDRVSGLAEMFSLSRMCQMLWCISVLQCQRLLPVTHYPKATRSRCFLAKHLQHQNNRLCLWPVVASPVCPCTVGPPAEAVCVCVLVLSSSSRSGSNLQVGPHEDGGDESSS